MVVKRLSYSPFGLGVEDTNEDLRMHVGWHGGLDLQEAGVLIIRQLNLLPFMSRQDQPILTNSMHGWFHVITESTEC